MADVSDNTFSRRLREGDALLGLYNGYPAEGILEAIGPGWDFVWIDGQHGQFSVESALRAVRTASALKLETVLRAPSHDPGLLGQYADTNASAVMIPQVDTRATAAAVVAALRFPPRGKRSFGGRRPIDVHGRDYYLSCEPAVIVQIESREGLENVDSIATTDGVDALFFGGDDMKLSLGLPVNTVIHESDLLVEAQRSVAAAARAAGKACGVPVANPDDLRDALGLGYRLLACGGDIGFLRTGSRQALEQSRRVLDEK